MDKPETFVPEHNMLVLDDTRNPHKKKKIQRKWVVAI